MCQNFPSGVVLSGVESFWVFASAMPEQECPVEYALVSSPCWGGHPHPYTSILDPSAIILSFPPVLSLFQSHTQWILIFSRWGILMNPQCFQKSLVLRRRDSRSMCGLAYRFPSYNTKQDTTPPPSLPHLYAAEDNSSQQFHQNMHTWHQYIHCCSAWVCRAVNAYFVVCYRLS